MQCFWLPLRRPTLSGGTARDVKWAVPPSGSYIPDDCRCYRASAVGGNLGASGPRQQHSLRQGLPQPAIFRSPRVTTILTTTSEQQLGLTASIRSRSCTTEVTRKTHPPSTYLSTFVKPRRLLT